MIPPHSPSYYWNIARATYKHYESGSNITDKTVYLQDTNINNYQVYLFRDDRRNELIVGFQGSCSFDHWRNNVTHFFVERTDILKAMRNRIKSWEDKFKSKITAYVGHSIGGYFATHVNEGDYRIYRITFNAYKALAGVRNWNFRTKNDPLSGGWTGRMTGADPDNYIVVGDGDHDLEDFAVWINRLTWEKRSKKKYAPKSSVTKELNSTTGGLSVPNLNLSGRKESRIKSAYDHSKELRPDHLSTGRLTGSSVNLSGSGGSRIKSGYDYYKELPPDHPLRNPETPVPDLVDPEIQNNLEDKLFKIQRDTDPIREGLKMVHEVLELAGDTKLVPMVQTAEKFLDVYVKGKQLQTTWNAVLAGGASLLSISGGPLMWLQQGLFWLTTAKDLYSSFTSFFDDKEQISALEKAEKCTQDFNKEIEETLNKLLAGQQEIKEKLESMRDDLWFITKDIVDRLQILRKEIQDRSDKKDAQEEDAAIQRRLLDFNKEIIVLRGRDRLKRRSDWNEGDFNDFILVFDHFLVDSSMPLLNGYGDYGEAPISKVALKPHKFTGLLANRIGEQNVINYYLFSEALGLFLKLCQDPFLSKHFPSRLIESGDDVKRSGDKLVDFFHQTEAFIKPAQQANEVLREFLERKIAGLKNNRINHRKRQIKDRWPEFLQMREKLTHSAFIGSNKFTISNLFYDNKVKVNFPQENLTDLKILISKTESWSRNERLTNFGEPGSEIGRIIIGAIKDYPMSGQNLPQTDRGRHYPVSEIAEKLLGALGSDDPNPPISVKDLIKQKPLITTRKFYAINSPIIETFEKTPFTIVIRKIDLNSDIRLEWIAESNLGFDFLRINSFSSDVFNCMIPTKFSSGFLERVQRPVKFTNGSVIQAEDVDKIPPPPTDANYDTTLKNLILEKVPDKPDAFLLKMQDDPDVGEEWISEQLAENSSVVMPLKSEDSIPLCFPNELIAYWEKILNMTDKESGFFLPYYDFTKEGKLYLVFHFVPASKEEIEYARINIATFDEITLNAFKPNMNEFLIQAMYGYFVGIGMPDHESHRLKNGSVVSHETEFPGLFQILKKKPALKLNFNCKKYDNEALKTISEAIENETSSQSLSSWFGWAKWEEGKKYKDVRQHFHPTLDVNLEQKKKPYEDAYNALLAHATLICNLPQTRIKLLIAETLGLLPPDVEGKEIQYETEADIDTFVDILRENPSEHVQNLKTNLEKLNEELAKLNDKK